MLQVLRSLQLHLLEQPLQRVSRERLLGRLATSIGKISPLGTQE
jgi:hypothetical protein